MTSFSLTNYTKKKQLSLPYCHSIKYKLLYNQERCFFEVRSQQWSVVKELKFTWKREEGNLTFLDCMKLREQPSTNTTDEMIYRQSVRHIGTGSTGVCASDYATSTYFPLKMTTGVKNMDSRKILLRSFFTPKFASFFFN